MPYLLIWISMRSIKNWLLFSTFVVIWAGVYYSQNFAVQIKFNFGSQNYTKQINNLETGNFWKILISLKFNLDNQLLQIF